MTLPVYFRTEAERDLDEAAEWYEKQQPGLGQQFLDEMLVTGEDGILVVAVIHGSRSPRRWRGRT